MNESIALFAYNFPHKKTQDFIFRILAEGFKIDVIYAADPVSLNIPKSSLKTKINHTGLLHPKTIAKNFGIEYFVLPHDSQKIINDNIGQNRIGIISGARILKRDIIECFPKGIVNFHPGIIPFARGLDALLWSVYNNIPLGVTAHLIDGKIDAGKILLTQKIEIYQDDTFLDLSERLYDIQLDLIRPAIAILSKNEGYILNNYGVYNRKMTVDLEQITLKRLNGYIKENS
jgi:methionyl-tRNA formyltransferase